MEIKIVPAGIAPEMPQGLAIASRCIIVLVAVAVVKVLSKAILKAVLRPVFNPSKSESSKETFDLWVRVLNYATLCAVLLDMGPLGCIWLGL